MKERFLKYLCCPDCMDDFTMISKSVVGDEIIEGTLQCVTCRKTYPITNHIPRIFDANIKIEKKKTIDAFSYEWSTFRNLSHIYKKQFLDWIYPIDPSFFKDKVVLDGGCGKGRHMKLASQFGAKVVIGIDLSNAVDVAYENTKDLENVCVIQADVYHLPLKRVFDYIYCIGVLHHLPYPASGFNSLLDKLKKGGTISAWVYGREGNWWIVYFVNPFRIFITSKLPPKFTKYIAYLFSIILYFLVKLIYKPIDKFKVLRPLKKILFYSDYLSYISRYHFKEIYSIVFDHLIAPTSHYISQKDFQSWFDNNELDDINISRHNNNSWRGYAIKLS